MQAQSALTLFQVSEIQVSYQPKFKAADRPVIQTSKAAYEIFYNNWDLRKIEMQEHMYILLLNYAHRVLGICQISAGGQSGTIADPKHIFSIALKANASHILIAHNHPSGNLKVSEADIRITRKLIQCGKFLDLQVLDHLIITRQGYTSMGDEGLL